MTVTVVALGAVAAWFLCRFVVLGDEARRHDDLFAHAVTLTGVGALSVLLGDPAAVSASVFGVATFVFASWHYLIRRAWRWRA